VRFGAHGGGWEEVASTVAEWPEKVSGAPTSAPLTVAETAE